MFFLHNLIFSPSFSCCSSPSVLKSIFPFFQSLTHPPALVSPIRLPPSSVSGPPPFIPISHRPHLHPTFFFFFQQSPAVLQSPLLLLIKLREIGCPRPNNPRGRPPSPMYLSQQQSFISFLFSPRCSPSYLFISCSFLLKTFCLFPPPTFHRMISSLFLHLIYSSSSSSPYFVFPRLFICYLTPSSSR